MKLILALVALLVLLARCNCSQVSDLPSGTVETMDAATKDKPAEFMYIFELQDKKDNLKLPDSTSSPTSKSDIPKDESRCGNQPTTVEGMKVYKNEVEKAALEASKGIDKYLEEEKHRAVRLKHEMDQIQKDLTQEKVNIERHQLGLQNGQNQMKHLHQNMDQNKKSQDDLFLKNEHDKNELINNEERMKMLKEQRVDQQAQLLALQEQNKKIQEDLIHANQQLDQQRQKGNSYLQEAQIVKDHYLHNQNVKANIQDMVTQENQLVDAEIDKLKKKFVSL